ncbi:gamma-glutamyl kinase [Phaeobacter gallaeciensis]|uniref:Gamma-glutamyl kinase n=2 Tax=Roseobacteraceae TaxID=2854170 RepID=A0A366WWF6_9RHOB|nr:MULTISPECIES: sulfotransferase family 2 domain-containing protein [Roseobacteraceae]MBT3140343.1 sulfotransferase family 2 domain-containing protein [Falsiruegeria litorea]MBT8171021.1 sulfotransferase family 2 domain-containing protein [Falsiruegeria litorea]RBW53437.1 gamma-glutamyl kinase [Phaeobacter gallaeciensis]
MLVFFKERLVLFSVPKTGTTALQTALRDRAEIVIANPPELKHTPLYRYNQFFKPMFSEVSSVEMETMAVVREPIDWLGSWYRYRRRQYMKGRPNSTHEVSFDDFVLAYMKAPRPGFANVGSQERFLRPPTGSAPVTHLFKYDSLPLAIQYLEGRLSVKLTLERENLSPEMTLYLSPEIERKFRQHHARDFEIYNSAS